MSRSLQSTLTVIMPLLAASFAIGEPLLYPLESVGEVDGVRLFYSNRTIIYNHSAIGDVNGDGYDDLLIATYRDVSPYPDRRRVLWGGPTLRGKKQIDLASMDPGTGFEFLADGYQRVVTGAGDVNADGFDDIIIGQNDYFFSGGNSNTAYVVFGGPSLGAGGVVDWTSLDGTNGFVITGAPDNADLGRAVAGVGDVNNDGIDDIAIGAPWLIQEGATFESGAVFVVFGSSSIGGSGFVDVGALTGSNGFVIRGFRACCGVFGFPAAGGVVVGAGDFDGDGYDDILTANPDGFVSVYCFVSGNVTVDKPAEVVLGFGDCGGTSDHITARPDWVLAGGGDMDGDGFAEILSGDFTEYSAYIHQGPDFQYSLYPDYSWIPITGAALGFSVSSANDFDGDGLSDALFGTLEEAWMVLGHTNLKSTPRYGLRRTDLHPPKGFVFVGRQYGDAAGHDVDGLGDVDGDGLGDVIISAPNFRNGNQYGETYLVFGAPITDCDTNGIADAAEYCGDLDRDGDVDGGDYQLVRQGLGHFDGQAEYSRCADYDGNGTIDATDVRAWFDCLFAYQGVAEPLIGITRGF